MSADQPFVQILLLLGSAVLLARVLRQVRAQRAGQYRQLRELFAGVAADATGDENVAADHLHALRLPPDSVHRGQPLSALSRTEGRLLA